LPAAEILPEPAVNDPPVGKEDAACSIGCRAVRAIIAAIVKLRDIE